MEWSSEPIPDIIVSHYGSSFVQQYINSVRQDDGNSPDDNQIIVFFNGNTLILLRSLL